MEFRLNFKINLIFYFLLLIYTILGLYLLHHYQYSIGADGMSYINISKLYLIGDFTDSINGYWGPLFSWMLLPFLKIFGSTPIHALYAAKVLSLIIGFFTIIGIRLFSYRFEMDEKVRYAILGLTILFILFVALDQVQPDLLLLCFLVYYLNIIYKKDYPNKYDGLLCGLLGGLAFLTKSYALPLFLATFIIFTILHYLKDSSQVKKKLIIKNFMLGLLLFLIIGGVWAAVISDKYGKVTISTSGEYNFGFNSPYTNGHPTQNPGFIQSPYTKAISAWEDPSYLNVHYWNPFKSMTTFNYFLVKVGINLGTLVEFINEFSYFAFIISLIYILFIKGSVKDLISKQNIFYPLITILILPLGYIITGLEIRYLWLMYVLLLLMGGYILNLLFETDLLNKTGKTLLTILFIISFIIMPLNGLIINYDSGKQLYLEGNILENQHITGNIASNGNLSDGYYGDTLALSYFLGTSYYGFSNYSISDNNLNSDLNKYGINYYFVWDNSSNNALLTKYTEVNTSIPNLRIYEIKGK